MTSELKKDGRRITIVIDVDVTLENSIYKNRSHIFRTGIIAMVFAVVASIVLAVRFGWAVGLWCLMTSCVFAYGTAKFGVWFGTMMRYGNTVEMIPPGMLRLVNRIVSNPDMDSEEAMRAAREINEDEDKR